MPLLFFSPDRVGQGGGQAGSGEAGQGGGRAGSGEAGRGGAGPRGAVPDKAAAARERGPSGVLLFGRVAAALGAGLVLFGAAVLLCTGLAARLTAVNPTFVMGVVREAEVLPQVRDELLKGLVSTSGLPPAERVSLRRALEDGVPVGWLDAQCEKTLQALAEYLGSDREELRIELALVELKVYLLMAIREHMGELFYVQAARGLQDLPDYLDVGGSFDAEALRRVRPVWQAVRTAPAAAGGAGVLASVLLWALAGARTRAVRAVGAVWLLAGLGVTGCSLALGALAPRYLPVFLSLEVPELGALPLREVFAAGLAGVRSALLATGTGVAAAGLFLAGHPEPGASR